MKRLLLAGVVGFVCLTAFARDAAVEITAENVLAAMNAYRAGAGLPPLEFDARLTTAAEDRMRDMQKGHWWNHESPDGRSPFEWLSVVGYRFSDAAENLATGFETTGVLVDAWINSPGHRRNILGSHYRDCGIAIMDGSTSGRTGGKAIVVLFGARKNEAGPPRRAALQ